jgi:hypothetical protein
MAGAGDSAPRIDRRALLSLAARSAATLGGLADARPGGAQAVTATTGRMARDLQEFERRCDLLRQAFAIPGMSIAVVQAQELILARGFGIVDLAEGTPAGDGYAISGRFAHQDICRSGHHASGRGGQTRPRRTHGDLRSAASGRAGSRKYGSSPQLPYKVALSAARSALPQRRCRTWDDLQTRRPGRIAAEAGRGCPQRASIRAAIRDHSLPKPSSHIDQATRAKAAVQAA